MSSLPADPDPKARKIASTVLQALASVGQARAAEVMGISESTVSRMKDGELDKFAHLLVALDLKIVPETTRVYDPKLIDGIVELAKQRMAEIESSSDLAEP